MHYAILINLLKTIQNQTLHISTSSEHFKCGFTLSDGLIWLFWSLKMWNSVESHKKIHIHPLTFQLGSAALHSSLGIKVGRVFWVLRICDEVYRFGLQFLLFQKVITILHHEKKETDLDTKNNYLQSPIFLFSIYSYILTYYVLRADSRKMFNLNIL